MNSDTTQNRSWARKALALLLIILASFAPGLALAAGAEAKVQLKFAPSDMIYLYVSLGLAILAILAGWMIARQVLARRVDNEKMMSVSDAIKEGALAYLRAQVRTMSFFVVILAVVLWLTIGAEYEGAILGVPLSICLSLSFILGVAASYIAGFVGMVMAVNGNARVAKAALTSYKDALETAFRSGAVAGLITVGMGLLGATVIFLVAREHAMKLLIGFGFGGSLAALFMRVGGGIYTKAADVGADLVGKVEAGIPEDDPRNAATIADNVGDNVGDCAGMAADVFESYEVTLVAAIVLGAATATIFDTATWMKLVLFALMARGVGIVASILGIFMVKGKDDENVDPLTPIRVGFWGSAAIAALGTVLLAWFMMQGVETRYYVDHNGKVVSNVTKVSFEDLRVLSAIDKVLRGSKANPLDPGSREIPAQPDISDEKLTQLVNDMLESEWQLQKEQASSQGQQVPDYTPVTVEKIRELRNSPMRNFTVISSRVPSGALSRITEGVTSPILLVKERTTLPAPEGSNQPPQTSESWQLRLESQLQQEMPGVQILEKFPVALGYGGPNTDGLYWIVEGSFPPDSFKPASGDQPAGEGYKALASLQPLAYSTKYYETPDFSAGQPDPVVESGWMGALAEQTRSVPWYLFALAIIAGIVMAYLIEQLTDYFVSFEKRPVREIASTSTAGPAPMIIQGFAYALESSVWAVLAIVLALVTPLIIFPPALYGGFILSFYGIALVGLGLLTTTGYILAMDTFGPISDNAQGVYEMSGAHELEKTEKGAMSGSRAVQRLDAAGNTTKALTKGFAIATAVVAAVALFHSFIEDAYLVGKGLPIEVPQIFLGLLIGGAVPFLFSAFSINAVGRAAFLLIQEVRRQFASDPGILKGTSKPDYGACVAIVTAAAQKELLGPGLLAICFPLLVGFGFAIGGETVEIAGLSVNITGAQALGGFLAGAILSGQLLAVLLANSGGAWDNAKKLIEDGNFGGKGSEAHKAGVVCDTVGDPFKDTAGPALNPLIKVMNLVALLLAGTLVKPMPDWIRYTAVGAAVVGIVIAVYWSKRGSLGTVLEAVQQEAAKGKGPLDGPAAPKIPEEAKTGMKAPEDR
ncbi:MAG: hypothetical protein KatS3mg015_2153 [Fimbriimonadales bacterium]|nr:MAG: hypothetical protein KatS3mg015_2153 [Fimbriimonadales bacterium]